VWKTDAKEIGNQATLDMDEHFKKIGPTEATQGLIERGRDKSCAKHTIIGLHMHGATSIAVLRHTCDPPIEAKGDSLLLQDFGEGGGDGGVHSFASHTTGDLDDRHLGAESRPNGACTIPEVSHTAEAPQKRAYKSAKNEDRRVKWVVEGKGT
jgi:hypothetical protein